MKFLSQINRNYLFPFFAVLLVMTIAGYFLVQVILTYDAKEKLLSTKYLVEQQIKNTGEIPDLHPLIEVQKTEGKPDIPRSYKKVTLRNEWEKEDEIFLELSSGFNFRGAWYHIKIRNPLFENEDLILILALTFFALLFSAFLISYLTTKRMNRSVWASFERNLHEIEQFSLRQNKALFLQGSNIVEFERLNHVLTDFTQRLKSDYLMLKEFTENASHELQTPVAIAQLNLEEILQHDVEEGVFKRAATAIQSLKRLSAINQSLILLAKIENRQFEAATDISFAALAKKKKEEFNIFSESKSLKVEIHVEGDFIIRINEYLSDILMGNLFANAIHHNVNGGIIRIEIKPDIFLICNTGSEKELDSKSIFNRFVSGNSKSSGLGLAIIRQICDEFHLDIQYVKTHMHGFALRCKT